MERNDLVLNRMKPKMTMILRSARKRLLLSRAVGPFMLGESVFVIFICQKSLFFKCRWFFCYRFTFAQLMTQNAAFQLLLAPVCRILV